MLLRRGSVINIRKGIKRLKKQRPERERDRERETLEETDKTERERERERERDREREREVGFEWLPCNRDGKKGEDAEEERPQSPRRGRQQHSVQ